MKTLTLLVALLALSCKVADGPPDAAVDGPLYKSVNVPNPGQASFFINQTDSFAATVSRLGMHPVAFYSFGADAGADAGVTPIRNAADLDTNFHNYLDIDGVPIPVLNGQLERYQSFDASANFVFAPASLNITATLDDGGAATIVGDTIPGGVGGIKLDGATANNFSAFAVFSPSSITLNRMVAVQFTGLYYVNTVTGSTSFTLAAIPNSGAPTAATFGPKGLAALPAYWVATNAAYVGGTSTLSFASVPAGVVKGMAVAADTGGNGQPSWFGQSYVTAVGATSVTLDVGNTAGFGSGVGVFFTPPIRSGQLWLKNYYGEGFGGVQAVAFESLVQVPGPTSTFCPSSSGGDCNPAHQPTTDPYGDWPATWIFSGAGAPGVFVDQSEIDLLEEFGESTAGSMRYSCSLGGTFSSPTWIYKNLADGGVWNSFHMYTSPTIDFSAAPHRWQLIWTGSQAIRYLDGTLMAIDNFYWSSGQQAQYGANLSAGSISKAFAGNLLFPYNTAEFPYDFQVMTMKVWQL